jgi:glycosyltransferase involved in cell wall biosynthesis
VNGFLDQGYGMTMASAGGRMLVREEAEYFELTPPAHFGLPWELNSYRFHFQAVRQVLRLAGRIQPAFIYQRMSVANYAGVPLSRTLKVPLIIEYNGSEAWVARNWGRSLRYQKLAEDAESVCLQHAHLVVTISDVLRQELLERGVPAERIVSYPNCIDPKTFDPERFSAQQKQQLRSRYGIAQDAQVATFVGTFGQWHGAEVLARAIRMLADDSPEWLEQSRLHVLFVGDGIKMPEVRAALGDLVPGPRVTLAGLVPQHEAPLHLAASDILVSPHVPNADGSRFFGSPTKLFEYLAMDKAILASDLDQIGDVLQGSARVDDNPAGSAEDRSIALLAKPGSAEDVAAGLKYLAENPGWRAEIGRRARALAIGRYTWQHHVGAILDSARRLDLLG